MTKYQKEASRSDYQRRLEKSAILALSLFILCFLLCPKFDQTKKEKARVVFTSLSVEDIPVTRQSTRHSSPPKPSVPIPSDDEMIPENLTIDETELDYFLASDGRGTGLTADRPTIFQPRPIFEVIPEYPQELQKKGIEGLVKLHLHVDETGKVVEAIVLENTTNNTLCENAAKAAALKGRYLPAKSTNKKVEMWITRTYTFGLQ